MSGQDQFHVLHQHFMEVGPAAKALLLSTYAKLANLYPECRELVTPVRTLLRLHTYVDTCHARVFYQTLFGYCVILFFLPGLLWSTHRILLSYLTYVPACVDTWRASAARGAVSLNLFLACFCYCCCFECQVSGC